MSRSQRLQRISDQHQQWHQERFNKAHAVKQESEETCTRCCENKDRQTCFRDGNAWCIACLDQVQQWHQERLNNARATKEESEQTCTRCCENKDRQTCFRDGNAWCIACLDQRRNNGIKRDSIMRVRQRRKARIRVRNVARTKIVKPVLETVIQSVTRV
jgi:hypothetical protein